MDALENSQLQPVARDGRRAPFEGLAKQVRHDKKIDGRADVYSLASVFYKMLVGRPPFTGPTVQAVIARITKERPPKIRVVRRDVPESVESRLKRLLPKRPATGRRQRSGVSNPPES